jgi:hypothetical protein
MKILKGLAFFLVFSVLGSCFDPPEFPAVPEIEFERAVFVETPGSSEADSLVLYINFKDGDGDLGLPSHGNVSDPYHPLNYFAGTSITSQDTVLQSLSTANWDGVPYTVLNGGGSGKLVTFDLRENSNYNGLPAYIAPYKCTRYNVDTLAIEEQYKAIIDNSYNIIDTAVFRDFYDPEKLYTFYYVADTFYIEPNPNYYNIEVDFFKYDDATDSYVEFDWRNYSPDPNTCGQTYDSRFPVLSENSTALDGTLTYAMRSIGFRKIFGTNILRLRIQIKDRALHLSNSITTPPFTLDDIKP